MRNIKKLKQAAKISVSALSLTMLFGFTSMAADDNITTMAATDYVNVRTQAGMQGKVIDVLSPKEAVQVTGIKNGWYHVILGDQKGYVYQEYLNFEGTAAGDINNGKKTEMKATGNVYVRADHNNSGKVLGVLSPEEQVNVTGKAGGWYQVDYNGKKGYVYGHYLDFINGDSGMEEENTGESVEQLVTTAAVNLRTDHSTDAQIIDVVPKGAVVEVTGHESGWYRVKYGNDSGFIYEEYLEEKDGSGAKKKIAAEGDILTTTAAVNLRTNSRMGTRVIRVVPAGAKVEVIDYENGWYRVYYDTDAGCIYGEYLE